MLETLVHGFITSQVVFFTPCSFSYLIILYISFRLSRMPVLVQSAKTYIGFLLFYRIKFKLLLLAHKIIHPNSHNMTQNICSWKFVWNHQLILLDLCLVCCVKCPNLASKLLGIDRPAVLYLIGGTSCLCLFVQIIIITVYFLNA